MSIWRRFFTRMNLSRDKGHYTALLTFVLILLLPLLIALSIGLGSVRIALHDIINAIIHPDQSDTVYQIIFYVRIPRTLAALLAGGALSVSGFILQSVLNNSLASPNTIGVNAGAGLFVILVSALFPSYLQFTPIAAFIGAMMAVFLVYSIAKLTGASRMAVILSGIAVSSFFGAITNTVLTIWPDTAISRTAFAIGGFNGVTMDNIGFSTWFILPSLIIVTILSYDLNLLTLGDDTAKSLGMNTSLFRFLFLTLAALLAGSAISFAGLLGFVGLIVPHASRFLVGSSKRWLVPFTALLGSMFTLFCDLLARVLFAPYEVPVGIIMSFIGGPLFIYLLFKGRQKRIYNSN